MRTRRGLALLVWGLAALAFWNAWVHRVAPSVMLDPLMAEFAVGAAVLGNLSALYYWIYAALQIPVGLAVDRWGPRLVLTVSLTGVAIASALFAGAGTLAEIYAARILVGAAAAFPFICALKLGAAWFAVDRQQMMAGATFMVGISGGLFGQAPLSVAVDAVGWHASMLGLAVLAAVLALSSCLLVRDRPTEIVVLLGPSSPRSATAGLAEALTNRGVWLGAGLTVCLTAPVFAFAALWGVGWLMQVHGLTRPEAAGTTSAMLVGWGVGGFVAGWVADRFGGRRPLLFAGILVAGGLFSAVVYAPGLPVAAFAPVLFVAGLAAGVMVFGYTLAAQSVSAVAGGTAYGVVNMAALLGGACSQSLVGLLLDWHWDGVMREGARLYDAKAYAYALITAPVLFAMAGLLALQSRTPDRDRP